MIEPKIFYRKLDYIQSKIGYEKTGKDYLFTIVKQLENTFGQDLKIANGCIYEQAEDEYVLVSSPASLKNLVKQSVPTESEQIQLIVKWKTYIFNEPVFINEQNLSKRKEYFTHVAFKVSNSVTRWIFVFELRAGWIREEVDLCLNAVRTALNHRLVSETVKSEVEQSVQIQQSLLPSSPPEVKGYQVAAFSQPAELVGGDLYDYYNFDDGNFGFCVGDASGHGLPAALMVRDVITGLRMGLEKHMKMVHTLKKLNSVIYQSVYSARFISLVYAEMEPEGNLFYANAGHPSPLLFAENKIVPLEPTGLIIGAFPDIELRRSFVSIPQNGILVLFTDGIIERKNRRSELFGVERIKSVVNENLNKSADDIMKVIFKSAFEFGKNKKWEDDATVMVIKRDK